MNIYELIDESHKIAVNSGFYDNQENDSARRDPNLSGTRLMLMVSELAEALEEIRDGNWETYYKLDGKPEGLPIELADLAIRLADYCGWMGIDLERAITEKQKYNVSRPYKHGKSV